MLKLKNSFGISILFLVIGFIGIAGSHYGDVTDDMIFKGISLAIGVTGLSLSLAFLIQSGMDKRKKKDETE